MGTTGKEGIGFVPDLMWCFGRGGKTEKLFISPQRVEEKEATF